MSRHTLAAKVSSVVSQSALGRQVQCD